MPRRAGSAAAPTVGVDGGFIELDASGACACGLQTLIYPRLVRHEVGHAIGYYHTDHVGDVMYGRACAYNGVHLRVSRFGGHELYAYARARNGTAKDHTAFVASSAVRWRDCGGANVLFAEGDRA